MTNTNELGPDQITNLDKMISEASERLETTGHASTNHAFNLGCSVGLIPALFFILLTYILTQGNWIAAVIMGLLMLLALLGFASFMASIARTNSVNRVYRDQIKPEIDSELMRLNIDQQTFYQFAVETLPEGATLLRPILSYSEKLNKTGEA